MSNTQQASRLLSGFEARRDAAFAWYFAQHSSASNGKRFDVFGVGNPSGTRRPAHSHHARHLLRGFEERRDAAFDRHFGQRSDAPTERIDVFGVGNFRGMRRPANFRGGVPRPSQRTSHPWRHRAGFVGDGSSAPAAVPHGHSATLVPTPLVPPTGLPQPGDSAPVHPPAQPMPPFYPCPQGLHPLQWDFQRGCPIDRGSSMGCTQDGVTLNCDSEQPCGVNVIGSNTLGTEGVPPREVVPLNVTAGDATRFETKALYFEALPYSDTDAIDVALLPPSRATMPVILVDALVGRISQLRRGGAPDVGLPQGAYSNQKELVPVDWAAFTSTTEHNLSLLFYNPNVNTPLHIFVALWGDI